MREGQSVLLLLEHRVVCVVWPPATSCGRRGGAGGQLPPSISRGWLPSWVVPLWHCATPPCVGRAISCGCSRTRRCTPPTIQPGPSCSCSMRRAPPSSIGVGRAWSRAGGVRGAGSCALRCAYAVLCVGCCAGAPLLPLWAPVAHCQYVVTGQLTMLLYALRRALAGRPHCVGAVPGDTGARAHSCVVGRRAPGPVLGGPAPVAGDDTVCEGGLRGHWLAPVGGLQANKPDQAWGAYACMLLGRARRGVRRCCAAAPVATARRRCRPC